MLRRNSGQTDVTNSILLLRRNIVKAIEIGRLEDLIGSCKLSRDRDEREGDNCGNPLLILELINDIEDGTVYNQTSDCGKQYRTTRN